MQTHVGLGLGFRTLNIFLNMIIYTKTGFLEISSSNG